MIPTFVFGWPTGEEKGDYLAVDLGEDPLHLHYGYTHCRL